MKTRLHLLLALLVVALAGAYYTSMFKPESPPGPLSRTADLFDVECPTDQALAAKFAKQSLAFPFKNGDRVAWIGSSSTYYGTWSSTLEFLLRTRHPELNLTFSRHSTGSGTFEVCADRLPDWLERSHPTLVFFNYGANDSTLGAKYINRFHTMMTKCVDQATASGARVMLMTHQPGDVRYTMDIINTRRKHYAYDMLNFASEKKWSIIDLYHPMEDMLILAQTENPEFASNTDYVHLTDSAYVAWGLYLYERLNPPDVESVFEIDMLKRKIVTEKNCHIKLLCCVNDPENEFSIFTLMFNRRDDVFPVLPPTPIPSSASSRGFVTAEYSALLGQTPQFATEHGQELPPRKLVPMESRSKYILKVTGLTEGNYEIFCKYVSLGKASAAALGAGVNLNSMVLDNKITAPWNDLAQKIWDGSTLEKLEDRELFFQVFRR